MYIHLLYNVRDADAAFEAAVHEMTNYSTRSVSAERDYTWSGPASRSSPWAGRRVTLGTFNVAHLGVIPAKGVVVWEGLGSDLATERRDLGRVGANLASGVVALFESIGATSAVGFGGMQVPDIWDVLTGVRVATDHEKEHQLLFAMGSTALVSYIDTHGRSWNGPEPGGGVNGASYYFG